MNKEEFVKGEIAAIYGVLISGIPLMISLLYALNLIPSSIFLLYISVVAGVLSLPLISYGCYFMAKGKGYHPIIGLLLSLILIGPIILTYLRYRNRSPNG